MNAEDELPLKRTRTTPPQLEADEAEQREAVRSGSEENHSEPLDGPELPVDVIGVIVSFAAFTPSECYTFALVSTQWFEGVSGSHTLWAGGGVLHNLWWPVGRRVPSILQRHEELDGQPSFRKFRTVRSQPKVGLAGLPLLQSLPNHFLSYNTTIVSLHLTDLPMLTVLEYGFLWQCPALTTVEVSRLDSLTRIGCGFLAGCTALKTVHLREVNSLLTIGDDFARGCKALDVIDLSGLCSVTTIGSAFLHMCKALKDVDLSPLGSVVSVGEMFLGWDADEISLTRFSNQRAN